MLAALVLSIAGTSEATATAPGYAVIDSSKANLPFTRCGHEQIDGYRYWSVQSYNMGCKNSRAVADRFTHAADRTPQGFSCKSREIKEGVSKHRCETGNGTRRKVVKFKTGFGGPA